MPSPYPIGMEDQMPRPTEGETIAREQIYAVDGVFHQAHMQSMRQGSPVTLDIGSGHGEA